MKKIKKIVALIIMAFVLVIVATDVPLFMGNATVEASAIKLNKTSITLYVGKTSTLKVIGTSQSVKWSSRNKKVATVSSKGKVTAKNEGKAIITAKVGSKEYTCTVTVKRTLTDKDYCKESFDILNSDKIADTISCIYTTSVIYCIDNQVKPKEGVIAWTSDDFKYVNDTDLIKSGLDGYVSGYDKAFIIKNRKIVSSSMSKTLNSDGLSFDGKLYITFELFRESDGFTKSESAMLNYTMTYYPNIVSVSDIHSFRCSKISFAGYNDMIKLKPTFEEGDFSKEEVAAVWELGTYETKATLPLEIYKINVDKNNGVKSVCIKLENEDGYCYYDFTLSKDINILYYEYNSDYLIVKKNDKTITIRSTISDEFDDWNRYYSGVYTKK